MEKHNEATRNRPDGDRAIDAPVLHINLAEKLQQLKAEKAWENNDRNAITLFKSGKFSSVLTALHKGAEMQTPQPQNLFTLQVLSGRLTLSADGKRFEAKTGELLALHEHVPYTVYAEEESCFLLTILDDGGK